MGLSSLVPRERTLPWSYSAILWGCSAGDTIGVGILSAVLIGRGMSGLPSLTLTFFWYWVTPPVDSVVMETADVSSLVLVGLSGGVSVSAMFSRSMADTVLVSTPQMTVNMAQVVIIIKYLLIINKKYLNYLH